ncbi:sugar porter family MFS transporter [Liquorilactobacillus oeni]|nr:sugar porter family MFS transporter [Liquorilactobacillus oeni]
MEPELEEQSSFLKYCVYVISLGGFLFGYDTGVINGALAFMSKPDQLNLSPALQGIVSSSLVIGACIGALFCGKLADRFGRKVTLRWIAIIFTIATICCALSIDFASMAIFRFILGLAVGAASSLSPMFLAEISPTQVRANNVNKNAIFIVLGQLVAFCFNALLGSIWGDWGPIWRVMIALACIPAIILWINSFNIIGSPHWLLQQRRFKRARHVFQLLGFQNIDFTKLVKGKNPHSQKVKTFTWRSILSHASLVYLLVSGIIIALIQQISGVNTVMYYGTILLEKVGMGQSGSLYANILIGAASVVASIFGTRLIERFDHRLMLRIGLVGNVVFLVLLGAIMHVTFLSQTMTNSLVLISLVLFLANHQGIVSPVTWLILAEMFPGTVKARFMSIATATTWITNFIISLIYPVLISTLGTAAVFFIFALTNGISFFLAMFVINQKKLRSAYQKNSLDI